MKLRILLIFAAALAMNANDVESLWLDVPFIKQERDGCGAASVAMLMNYWQVHDSTVPIGDAVSIRRALYLPKEHGIRASAMKTYLDQNGFRAFAFAGEWSDLRHHIANGRPLIVALKTGEDSFHYVVVAGVGEGTIVLNDPADRKLRKYDRKDFEKRWTATGRWTLLAVPRPVE